MKSLFDYLNETVYASKPRAEYIIKSLTDAMGVEITGSIKTVLPIAQRPAKLRMAKNAISTFGPTNG